MTPEDLIATWRAEEDGQPVGWNFSALAGRMTETATPWDLDATYRAVLGRATAVLDMGTGGGEHLLRYRDMLPDDTTATEGWAPNVPVARTALEPAGIRVVEFGQPDDDPAPVPMPFPDGRFDVVLSRHEAYHPAEVARVLRPGGLFLTQQVGGDEVGELSALTGRPGPAPHVRYGPFRAELERTGFDLLDGGEAVGQYAFRDVAALVAYLRRVPWDAPADFSVEKYADALLALHRAGPARGAPVRLTRTRFWLLARRAPADGGQDRGTPSAVVVRERADADIPDLVEALAAQQPASGYPHRWPLPFPVERFVVRDAEERAWVAESDGRVVGHVGVTTVRDDEHGRIWSSGAGRPVAGLACVAVLFVHPDAQGRGLGGRLLDHAAAWVRSTGRTPVLHVDDHDGVAHAVYLRKGWRIVGEARFAWQRADAPPARLMVLP